MIYDRVGLKV